MRGELTIRRRLRRPRAGSPTGICVVAWKGRTAYP